jgi:hypothetical protein
MSGVGGVMGFFGATTTVSEGRMSGVGGVMGFFGATTTVSESVG